MSNQLAHEPIPPLVAFCRQAWQWFVRMLWVAARNGTFRRWYAIGTVVVLLGTTLLWATLGARLQTHNADQLSDPYLFSSWSTFHAASFPGAHTFLLKWPIFWLVSAFGLSPNSLLVAVVGLVLVTVAALVAVIYKIERRPLVFGTICLGLALVLLLIPAQPYAGGILPVNMAMLTTRNLEYAVYLAVLVLFVRAGRLWSYSFAFGVLLLTLLIASDKLFLSLSAGGALLALLLYALLSNWAMTTFAVRWLAGSILGALGSMLILFAISALHLTHLVSGGAATPYGVVLGVKGLVLGVVYAVAGLFTNFGANPAYDGTILSQLPGRLVHGLWSFSGAAYIVAAGILLCGLLSVWCLLRPTLKSRPRAADSQTAHLLSLALVLSTIAAFGVFIVTDHYYAVDARYLTISLFALAVTTAAWLRELEWRWSEDLLMIACVVLLAIAIAIPTTLHISRQQNAAFDTVSDRNARITETLKRHKVDLLVGDYWRVLPVKLVAHNQLTVLPLSGCTQPATILTSGAWQPDLKRRSFAYLITLDGSLTGYPNCTFAQIVAKYGTPNATQIIAGSVSKPAEALMFYNAGSAMPRKPTRQIIQTSILPVDLADVSHTSCEQSTIMNVVAHEDDDLLFLSPDLLHDIQLGHCVRTVFLTAGDAGEGKFYWISRQLGSEAAYSTMLGIRNIWDQQTVKIASGQYVTIATPRGNTKVSLVFLNLPDGNLGGQGFPVNSFESLAQLHNGQINTIHAVDGESRYTSVGLVTALSELMNTYQPAIVRTQADVISAQSPDHSDHITAGLYAQSAAAQYDQIHFGGALVIPVVRYIGYPTQDYPANLSDIDTAQKEAAFMAYAQYDDGVCHSIEQCIQGATYGFYLTRQYQQQN